MYLIQVDHVVYEHREGRPFTLAEAWRGVEGVGGARIVDEGGRVVLANAGSLTRRLFELSEAYRTARYFAAMARNGFERPDVALKAARKLRHIGRLEAAERFEARAADRFEAALA